MDIALGDLYSGVFTTSDKLWDQLRVAGETEFDRFWRMPLDEDYGPQIYSSNADLCNVNKVVMLHSCFADYNAFRPAEDLLVVVRQHFS